MPKNKKNNFGRKLAKKYKTDPTNPQEILDLIYTIFEDVSNHEVVVKHACELIHKLKQAINQRTGLLSLEAAKIAYDLLLILHAIIKRISEAFSDIEEKSPAIFNLEEANLLLDFIKLYARSILVFKSAKGGIGKSYEKLADFVAELLIIQPSIGELQTCLLLAYELYEQQISLTRHVAERAKIQYSQLNLIYDYLKSGYSEFMSRGVNEKNYILDWLKRGFRTLKIIHDEDSMSRMVVHQGVSDKNKEFADTLLEFLFHLAAPHPRTNDKAIISVREVESLVREINQEYLALILPRLTNREGEVVQPIIEEKSTQTGLTVVTTPSSYSARSYSQAADRPARVGGVQMLFENAGVRPLLVDSAIQPDELTLAHTTEYLEFIRARTAIAHAINFAVFIDVNINEVFETGNIVPETFIDPETYCAVMQGSQAVLVAVDQIKKNKDVIWFARPPGHHAAEDAASGFCVVNNAAFAALHLIQSCSERSVLVVDVDIHQGDGTASQLKKSTWLEMIDLFNKKIFPGNATDLPCEQSEERYYGVPLDANISEGEFLEALERALRIKAQRLKEKQVTVLLSAGFDGHENEELLRPQERWKLTSNSYGEIVTLIKRHFPAAHQLVMLEGGYNPEAVSASMCSIARTLQRFTVKPVMASRDLYPWPNVKLLAMNFSDMFVPIPAAVTPAPKGSNDIVSDTGLKK